MTYRKSIHHLLSTNFIIPFIALYLFSCHSIKPIVQNNLLQSLNAADLAKLDGEYEIISSDTSYPTLARALTFTDKKYLINFDQLHQLVEKNVRLKITSLDATHLKINVYNNEGIVKTKVIKGELDQNYFVFRQTKISPIVPFFFILSLVKKQENRIGLTKSGDLLLDSYEGGVLLFLFMPTFGGDAESYNLIFRRKKSTD